MTVDLKITTPVDAEKRPSNIFQVHVELAGKFSVMFHSKFFWGGYDEIVPKLEVLSHFFSLENSESYWPDHLRRNIRARFPDAMWEWYEGFVGQERDAPSWTLYRPRRVRVYWFDITGQQFNVEVEGLLTKENDDDV